MKKVSVGAGDRSYVNCEERRGVVNRRVKQISKMAKGKGGMMLRCYRRWASEAESRVAKLDLQVGGELVAALGACP